MKYLIFILFIAFYSANAQFGKAKYTFSTSKAAFESELFFSPSKSLYLLYVSKPTVPPTENLKEQIIDQANSEQVITVDINDGDPFTVYKDVSNGVIVSRELVYNGEKMQLTEPLPQFDWVILNEKKDFGGIICQKATLTYRCADYTAWFAPSIPVTVGPWKMGGLPGLIVELKNETVGHTYSLTQFQYPISTLPDNLLEVPRTKDKPVDYDTFAKIQQKELDKMRIYLESQAGNPHNGSFQAKIPECFQIN